MPKSLSKSMSGGVEDDNDERDLGTLAIQNKKDFVDNFKSTL